MEAERSFISATLYGVKFQKIFTQNSSKQKGGAVVFMLSVGPLFLIVNHLAHLFRKIAKLLSVRLKISELLSVRLKISKLLSIGLKISPHFVSL
jgi:hypothetical protein